MKPLDIGERIKNRRIELGLTQEELASKLGYKSKSTINKIELGINDITQSKVVKFANVLNTSVAYLMGWEGKGDELASFHARILKDIPLMEALEDYYRLSKKNQKIVRDLIHSMAESEA